MKIAIIGYSGSGKSTLAQALAVAYNAPALYLDQVHWLPGWVERPAAEEQGMVERFLNQQDSWVIDGNYLRTLPRRLERCDAVVLLDYPRRVCLFRALRRILSWRGRTRPDMAADCPERLDGEFVRWIWEFHRTQRPQVLELLNRWEGEKHVFRSPRACADFLSRL